MKRIYKSIELFHEDWFDKRYGGYSIIITRLCLLSRLNGHEKNHEAIDK